MVEEVGRLLNADMAGMVRYLPGGETAPVATWPAGGPPDGAEPGPACPVVVGGRVWGELFAHATDERTLPRDAGSRLADFTELVAAAIANAEARTELAASRSSVVAAADEERRRVVRDLHDGARQRLRDELGRPVVLALQRALGQRVRTGSSRACCTAADCAPEPRRWPRG